MSDGEGPRTADILVGLFMLVAGLCITLLGGGCTLLMLTEMRSSYGGDMGGMLLLSLVILAGGIGMLWVGFKLLTGKYRS
jgi:hypothetical protein